MGVAAVAGAEVKQALGEEVVDFHVIEEEVEILVATEASLEIGLIDLEAKIKITGDRVPIIQQPILVNSTDLLDQQDHHPLTPRTLYRRKIHINWIPVC